MTMLLNKSQLTTSLERTRPTITTLPTLQCVVDTGIPRFDARSTVNAEPISMQKPLEVYMIDFVNSGGGYHVRCKVSGMSHN